MRVIVCQIGAREHYAAPRTLHRAGLLAEMITDVWIPPNSPFRNVPGGLGERLRGRYHPELDAARVTHFTISALGVEMKKVASRQKSRWDELIERNRWFQAMAVRHLKASGAVDVRGDKPVVLAYSYAARDILAIARDAGARTILAQIDGGEADEALIAKHWSKRSEIMPDKAPGAYWASWREECRLADRILVNSEWSKQLLARAGVDDRKLVVTPVVYESSGSGTLCAHAYPQAFDAARPLRVLFLGALTLRKGVVEALEAARALADRPVQFLFVGEDAEARAPLMGGCPNVARYNRVPRNRVAQFYRDADVFLFPTHSDGFGMTQIEALESGLPVIASRNCAAVVEHGRTGLLLESVSAADIVRAINVCLDRPERLAAMSVTAIAAGAAFANSSATALLDVLQEFSMPESR